MKLTKLCAVALAAIATMTVATASHSTSPCGSTVEELVDDTLYLINDDTGTWIYLESNGHDELQRGGAAWYEVGTGNGIDANCWDVDSSTGEQIADPDLIIL